MESTAFSTTSEARVTTVLAAPRYLGQLCKHFQHKLPASYDEDFRHGRIEFPFGLCTLSAEADDTLLMTAAAGSPEDLARLEGVIASHLERFAFRETFTIEWQKAA